MEELKASKEAQTHKMCSLEQKLVCNLRAIVPYLFCAEIAFLLGLSLLENMAAEDMHYVKYLGTMDEYRDLIFSSPFFSFSAWYFLFFCVCWGRGRGVGGGVLA